MRDEVNRQRTRNEVGALIMPIADEQEAHRRDHLGDDIERIRWESKGPAVQHRGAYGNRRRDGAVGRRSGSGHARDEHKAKYRADIHSVWRSER